MSTENKTGKNIWDVIFSQDKHHFPIERNYLIEPRGSLNPINAQVTEKVCPKMVDSVRKNFTDPYKLYALDFHFNYAIRQMADLSLFAGMLEFPRENEDVALDSSSPKMKKEFEKLETLPGNKWNEDIGYYNNDEFRRKISASLLSHRKGTSKIEKRICESNRMPSIVKLLQTLQYVIENSEYDWKTKAEAFLRASSMRGYCTADDETIIYLMYQSLDDKELEKEARYRWKRYKKEWGDLYFTDKNPFKGKFSIDRLRFIHWDKLSCLRPLEPFKEDDRDTYGYKAESQHLLSPEYVSDFARVMSLFRTDLDVDPIRSHLVKLINKYFHAMSGSHSINGNYTMSDFYYLSDLLFTFAIYRFRNDINAEDEASLFVHKTRKGVEISYLTSTATFSDDVSMVTLIALEVLAIYYSRPKGMVEFLQKAREWLLSQQTPYGYWYDGANNPEYTTVLVLDAINLIDGTDGLSFPMITKPRYDKTLLKITDQPRLRINYTYHTLFLGNREIPISSRGGESKTWEFLQELNTARQQKLPLPRYHYKEMRDGEGFIMKRYDWKNQYDSLRRLLGEPGIIKQFIISDGDSYHFTDNVIPIDHSEVWSTPGSDLIDKMFEDLSASSDFEATD